MTRVTAAETIVHIATILSARIIAQSPRVRSLARIDRDQFPRSLALSRVNTVQRKCKMTEAFLSCIVPIPRRAELRGKCNAGSFRCRIYWNAGIYRQHYSDGGRWEWNCTHFPLGEKRRIARAAVHRARRCRRFADHNARRSTNGDGGSHRSFAGHAILLRRGKLTPSFGGLAAGINYLEIIRSDGTASEAANLSYCRPVRPNLLASNSANGYARTIDLPGDGLVIELVGRHVIREMHNRSCTLNVQ